LGEASHLLERQVAALGIKTWGCAFHIFRENDSLEWHSNADGVMPTFVIPRTYVWQRYYEACQRGETLHIEEHAGEACIALYEYMAAMPIVGEALQKMKAAGIPFPTYQVDHAASFKYGYLLFITFEQVPAAHDIFKRFAKVFEQTYTRFLDLQKAEAQAREAQIEAALERVRSRTMAMQRSDDLQDAASLLFQQVKALGTSSWTCGFQIWDEDKKSLTAWMGTEVQLDKFIYPGREDATLRFYEALLQGETLYVEEIGGEAIKAHYDFMKTIPGPREALQRVADAGFPLPTFQIFHVAYFTQGFLLFITYEQVPEMHDVFKRFAKVFEQTYTRFLDLQKAEAQAREAHIEAALERVRSRTMAMQRSEELTDAAALLFQQIEELGVHQWGNAFQLWDDDMKAVTSWTGNQGGNVSLFKIPATEDPVMINIVNAAQNGEALYVEAMGGKALESHYKYMTSLPGLKEVFEKLAEDGFTPPKFQVFHAAYFSSGYILFITHEPYPEAHDIFKRFAKVFEQTYTRFLDLQKAEAQARESKIEAALERVRSRTMAMQRSEELTDVATILFQQVKALGVPQWTCGLNIWEIGDKDFTFYPGSPDGTLSPLPCKIPLTEDAVFILFDESRRRGDELCVYESKGEIQETHYRYMLSLPGGLGKMLQDMLDAGYTFPTFQIDHLANFSYGNLLFITYEHVPEMHDVFKRFAKVFEQTYTRFLDLQKAEAQARESQIEAALERVRSRTMAMQKTDELLDAGELLYRELSKLGIPSMTSGYVLMDEAGKIDWQYMVSPEDGSIFPEPLGVPRDETKAFRSMTASWENLQPFNVVELNPEETIVQQTYVAEHVINFHYTAAELISFSPERLVIQTFNFKQGYLAMVGGAKLSSEQIGIVIRFARVFEQTYTRFLDLQKAEAQAREAQIEAALERVRSRTMGMQKSEELAEVATVLFQQVKAFGIPQWTCGFSIFEIGDQEFTFYPGSPDGDILAFFKVPLTEHPIFIQFDESRKRGDELFIYEKEGEIQADHYRYMLSVKGGCGEWLQGLLDAGIQFPDFQIDHLANFSHGNLIFITYEPVPEMHDIFKRFAKVFEQTYTRFLDLQKAESQAREAQIEASLERVRSKTMAMFKSEELNEIVFEFYKQMNPLGFAQWACIIALADENKGGFNEWLSPPTDRVLPECYHVPVLDHPAFEKMWSAYIDQIPYLTIEASDVEKRNWDLLYFEKTDFKKVPQAVKESILAEPKVVFSIVSMRYGLLIAVDINPIPEEMIKILGRFAKVFEQTYTRFLDLQKAEAQAREAVKQSSLDRVRGQIASMRTTTDLERITPIIWHELISLDVPFVRCGVFIMNEETAHVQAFLSAPDGHSLAALDLPFDSSELTINSVNHWRKGLIFKTHWNKEDFLNFMQSMVKEGQVQNTETYQGASKPPESLDLHFVPFAQGMLYVGNIHPLKKDELDLVKSLAEAFSIAYARYEDFKKLETAKQSIETTLSELKAAQSQLIQAEKMASLGELTAGIAHEIQNPLNFVNNFSEVNTELIEEMKTELRAGNNEDAIAIANDIAENEQKINHHGKRADAIVKGMLQHSRSSSGVKEPTDINALADEYLRLAYHGLRAKDKSFNATLKMDFDESIGKIDIIPQDIGRVILNLITNAFYAVNEKKQQLAKDLTGFENLSGLNGYEPTVSVSTRRTNDKVEVFVKDNGNGIPQKVLDKIFQPFFTTKPTGEGTGLGLSLAYDIVKAHGGELKVETKEGEGSEFIIQLPVV